MQSETKILTLAIALTLCQFVQALDYSSGFKLPDHHEMVAISPGGDIWIKGRSVDEAQLIATIEHLKTNENLQVIVIFADFDIDKSSEAYIRLVKKISEIVKVSDSSEIK